MTNPQIPFNLIPTNPHLTDALNLLKRDIMLNLSAHHIGTVQSFDAELQTCNATINYPKTYFELNAATGLYSPVLVSYPVLLDCPAIFPGGGKGALTMPVKTGDECLVIFNDRDLDNWFQGGAGAAVATPRTHSFADGIILVGLRSQGNVLSTFDLVRAVLRGGSGVVGVNTSNNKVLVTNSTPSGSAGNYTYSTTLGTLIQTLMTQLGNLCTALEALTVTCATPGNPSSPPINSASFTAVATALSSLATSLGGLLE